MLSDYEFVLVLVQLLFNRVDAQLSLEDLHSGTEVEHLDFEGTL